MIILVFQIAQYIQSNLSLRTPLYYGQFGWSQKCQNLYIPYSVYNTDTSVKRRLGSVPLASVLKRFDYLKPRPGFLDFHFTVQYPLFVLIQRRQCQCGQFSVCCTRELKGDVTWDDSQPRLLAQHIVAMLEQCCNYSKQCCNNVALKIVVAISSRVTST